MAHRCLPPSRTKGFAAKRLLSEKKKGGEMQEAAEKEEKKRRKASSWQDTSRIADSLRRRRLRSAHVAAGLPHLSPPPPPPEPTVSAFLKKNAAMTFPSTFQQRQLLDQQVVEASSSPFLGFFTATIHARTVRPSYSFHEHIPFLKRRRYAR